MGENAGRSDGSRGRLRGRSAVVTGAGSGIGRATAALFAREGARVLAADVDGEAADATAAGIVRDGGVARAAHADISVRADVEAMIAAAVDAFGGLDILVNNAGFGVVGDITQTSDEDLARILAVNVTGTFMACRAAIPAMLRRGGGAIVNVASVAALAAVRDRAAYIASKGAIVALTRSISVDFIERGIRCNCIAPGTTDSPWVERMVAVQADPDEARRLMIARQPLGRLGTPDEIARAILYLASDEASFVHGSCLVADGGFLAR